jgi:hypothetical protein
MVGFSERRRVMSRRLYVILLVLLVGTFFILSAQVAPSLEAFQRHLATRGTNQGPVIPSTNQGSPVFYSGDLQSDIMRTMTNATRSNEQNLRSKMESMQDTYQNKAKQRAIKQDQMDQSAKFKGELQQEYNDLSQASGNVVSKRKRSP